jgi:hypothetical protein
MGCVTGGGLLAGAHLSGPQPLSRGFVERLKSNPADGFLLSALFFKFPAKRK